MRKFVFILLAIGTPCLVIGEVLSLGKGDTLGSIGFLIFIVALFCPLSGPFSGSSTAATGRSWTAFG